MDQIIESLRNELRSFERLVDRADSALTFAKQMGGSSANQLADLSETKFDAENAAFLIKNAIKNLELAIS